MAAAPLDTGLILAGGLALGAYQLGTLEPLLDSERITIKAIAGASIGAINGAVLAGNPPEAALERLAAMWEELVSDHVRDWLDPLRLGDVGVPRKLASWLNVAAVRLAGNRALFRSRSPFEPDAAGVPSLYIGDRAPELLARYIDFDRLNNGEVRFCCVATDIETGECVTFDTACGDTIGPEHLIASGSLLPAFPPVPLNGRLLGDGGFTANAPLEPFLAHGRIGEPLPLCILMDLFAPDAPPPHSLEKSAERASDLKYACQTTMRLEALQRERALELRVPELAHAPGTDLLYLRCHTTTNETGSEKPYDFSRSTLAERRERGRSDGEAALARFGALAGGPGLRVTRV